LSERARFQRHAEMLSVALQYVALKRAVYSSLRNNFGTSAHAHTSAAISHISAA
jgi:hypothetical protein